MTPIKLVSVNEHYTFEECAGVDLRDVVTRDGFQGIQLVPTRKPDGTNGEPLVVLRYVHALPVDDEAQANK